MKRTKIVCTIGPASWDSEVVKQLIEAGMDVARLNFSHGTTEEHARLIETIRSVSREMGKPVAILQDLAGPKIRIGDLATESIELAPSSQFTLTSRDVPGDADEVSVGYKGLPNDVQPGDTLLLSDGAIELRVEQTDARDIHCRVIVGGSLTAHKGVNVPSRSLRVDFPTEKDKRDLIFGMEHDVDFVALSFVRSAADIEKMRALAVEHGSEIKPTLIAKIEKHEALANIDAIIEAADGLMVARGDLGVEIPIEQVPRVQKNLIRKANRAAKPVITATQMLRSMVSSPRPTRAEATDVANAVYDGTDAVMLSEETAEGSYPVESVRMMARLVSDAESESDVWRLSRETETSLPQQEAVALAAKQLAGRIGAAAIATCTQSGSTTRLISKYRPDLPLLALTPDPRVLRQLKLVWGAVPLMIKPAVQAEELERQAIRAGLDSGLIAKGDTIVITVGLPLNEPGITNTVKVAVAE